VVAAIQRKLDSLASCDRYEDAAIHRDRLVAFVRAAARCQRLGALTAVDELVAALPDGKGGWELSVIRRGRMVASGRAPAGAGVRPYVAALKATAETVIPGPGPLPAASAEEVECVLRWLETPGCRMVECEGTWASPAFGAAGHREWLAAVRERALTPGDAGQPDMVGDRRTQAAGGAESSRRSGGFVVTAVVLIKAAVERIPEVAAAIADLEGVTEVYSVTGEVDLVAMVRVRRHEQLADVIADRMNKVDGVTHTETLIAFRAYSKHDLQAAFSLGSDDSD
jgi:DNA-binding Lrp family transcriptional regulator